MLYHIRNGFEDFFFHVQSVAQWGVVNDSVTDPPVDAHAQYQPVAEEPDKEPVVLRLTFQTSFCPLFAYVPMVPFMFAELLKLLFGVDSISSGESIVVLSIGW